MVSYDVAGIEFIRPWAWAMGYRTGRDGKFGVAATHDVPGANRGRVAYTKSFLFKT